ncbi:MAG: hypothetical protein WCT03_01490 [Candidatus Obscuribacterales bacterium]
MYLAFLLAVSHFLPVLPVTAAPDRVATEFALTALGRMKASQRILGQFLHFLAARKSTALVSERQAEMETARFVSGIKDPKVLLDLALAIQMKINIYSYMPASDMALWRGLYRNCTQRTSIKSDKQAQFLLSRAICPMKHSGAPRSRKRTEILARQFQAVKVMDLYLSRAHSQTIIAGPRNSGWTAIGRPLVRGVSDIDVLTDIASGAYCKTCLDDEAAGAYDFFFVCVDRVVEKPKSQALDAIYFFYCISSGGAATSECLNEYEAKVLGMSMPEFIKYRSAKNKQR